MIKLHLGCGQRYLNGYINIDYPLYKHTVQNSKVADLEVDLLELKYISESIEEIRLHHVLEHFDYSTVCALLLVWNNWLKDKGVLHIEVPDYFRTSLVVLNPFKRIKYKRVAIRHIFGSHEAEWAIHKCGYTKSTIKDLLSRFGFKTFKFKSNYWRGTYNFEVLSFKSKKITYQEAESIAKEYLSEFLVDNSEEKLLEIWIGKFKEIYRKMLII